MELMFAVFLMVGGVLYIVGTILEVIATPKSRCRCDH